TSVIEASPTDKALQAEFLARKDALWNRMTTDDKTAVDAEHGRVRERGGRMSGVAGGSGSGVSALQIVSRARKSLTLSWYAVSSMEPIAQIFTILAGLIDIGRAIVDAIRAVCRWHYRRVHCGARRATRAAKKHLRHICNLTVSSPIALFGAR